MFSSIKQYLRNFGVPVSAKLDREQFSQNFFQNLEESEWQPHPLYNVFTQYDQEWYLAQEDAFMHKYQCFYAVSKTISPKRIIELGACAGASGDAYLSAAPEAKFIGLDVFGVNVRHDDGTPWDPYKIAVQLFTARGFKKWKFIKKWKLIRADLRKLDKLPAKADFVVVDAAHDFDNEYADLKLALTANPTFIFVDDADDENGAKPAIEKFLQEDLRDRVDYTFPVNYVGGGLVIKLKNS
jgi:predicted O-methyltransferase YrrM